MKQVVKLIATIIWELSEAAGIGLGHLAPLVFELMIGYPGKKIK